MKFPSLSLWKSLTMPPILSFAFSKLIFAIALAVLSARTRRRPA
jgi:hypothetical protein